MRKIDRLSALLDHFALTVTPTGAAEANFVIVRNTGVDGGWRILVDPNGPRSEEGDDVAFSAHMAWGGESNPLLTALPDGIAVDVPRDDELALLIQVLIDEGRDTRCGHVSIMNRLGEVLVVRFLRAALERGTAEAGILAGLADPRLSRAIVAMHESPGRAWRNDDLAALAGLSRSRFAEVFRTTVGETPAQYLRRWRLVLARQDIARGDRIQAVARRYAYASGEALTHAFQRQFGHSPRRDRAHSQLAGP